MTQIVAHRFPAGIHKHNNDSSVYIYALELLRVITEYLVKFFNNGYYVSINYSFLVISRQISVLN